MTQSFNHITVLKDETIQSVLPCEELIKELKSNGMQEIFIIDATLGGAGHALHLVDCFKNSAKLQDFKLNLIAFDRDSQAIAHAKIRLENKRKENPGFNFTIFQENFGDCIEILKQHYPQQKIHGVYADLGVSSPQLDEADRGFSILKDGPVDMRMDATQKLTAKEILLTYSENELVRLFFDYGEEPRSKKLAKSIVQDRVLGTLPLESTKELANYIKVTLAYPTYSKAHPATRVFQALRIEVNNELGSLEKILNNIPEFIHTFGKSSFISFHSLEDRIVKHAMRNWQKGKMAKETDENKMDHRIPLHIQLHMYENKRKSFGVEKPRGGLVPSDEEIKQNSRSRSARLRCFQFDRNTEG